jgi:hypothetical protein
VAVIALASAKSCGVTTSALALALTWPRACLMAECDPSGGTVAVGYLEGRQDASRGLHRLGLAHRQGTLAEAFCEQLIRLPLEEERLLLLGLTDPAQASALARTWDPLARMFAAYERVGTDVIVDAGRLTFDAGQLSAAHVPAPILRQADVVLVVARNTSVSLSATAPALRLLREDLDGHGSGADALRLLLIEEGPYRDGEVRKHLGTAVAARLANDPAAAQHLSHGAAVNHFGRSALIRSARSANDRINELITARRERLVPARPAGGSLGAQAVRSSVGGS